MNKPKHYPFVEPEIAILANKHHGFAFYEPSDLNYFYNIDLDDDILYKEEECNDYECYAAAPLYQQLVDWFREEQQVRILIDEDFDNGLGYLRGWIPKVNGRKIYSQGDCFDNYYDALQEAIKKAFELI